VVFLFTGLHADYHRPSDTADKINYDGMAQIAELSERIVRGLDQMPAEELAQAGAKLSPSMPGGGGGGHGGASLGVMPDYSSAGSVSGVLITGTTPKSAAELAGLREGDRIIALGDKKIDNLEDLADVLGQAHPGDKVKIKIVRGTNEQVLDATLGERR
jgi:S1-C subfamily serine protease